MSPCTLTVATPFKPSSMRCLHTGNQKYYIEKYEGLL